MKDFQSSLDDTDAPPYIVAELNTGHRGNVELAKAAISEAVRCGANAVKFQSWKPESLFTESYLLENGLERRFYERFSLPQETLQELFSFASSIGAEASSTAYSLEEVDFLGSIPSVPFIKIASMDLTNIGLVRHALQTGKLVIVSTGLATAEEVERSINEVADDITGNLIVFHCTSRYPTPLRDSAIGNIKWLQGLFPQVPIGFSDHTEGSAASILALSLGTKVFEKHFTLDKSKPGFDNAMAADVESFEIFVTDLHDAHNSLRAVRRHLTPEEQDQSLAMRRSAFAGRNLSKGEILVSEDLSFKRPGDGLGHFQAEQLIGKRLAINVAKDTLLLERMFEKEGNA